MKAKSIGFFVTGTGTDVGKTFVSRLLVEAMAAFVPVSYMKPVQTGCRQLKDGMLSAPDFEYVRKSGGLVLGADHIHVPYRFVPACSPHLAAQRAHAQVSIRKIKRSLDMIRSLPGMRGGCVFAEGAGGVMVPLGPSVLTVNLMELLKLPVVLVTTPELGTLNHTFLTMCAIEAAGLSLAGLVINNRNNVRDDFIYRDNVRTLRNYARNVPFLVVPYGCRCLKKTKEFCDELLR